MNIYLDIDGTILTKDKQPAKNLDYFLNWCFSKGDVYWLTTHCKENKNKAVLTYLQPFLNQNTMDLVTKIKPSKWNTLKTEAINFDKPFLWFDDYLLYVEQEELKKRGVFDSWVQVNLNKDDLTKLIATY